MKTCPTCGDIIKGRKDKIYCSASCKSAAQYESRSVKEKFFLDVDKQLKTNRKILKRHNQAGFTTLRREKLIEEGFNPRFFTHYWKNKQHQIYFFCYEFGFSEIERDGKKKYLLVEWQTYMEK